MVSLSGAGEFRRAIERNPFCVNDGHTPMRLTASIGVSASESPSKLMSADILVQECDLAMYQAKQSGKNCVSVWESSDTSSPAGATAAARLSRVSDDANRRRLHDTPFRKFSIQRVMISRCTFPPSVFRASSTVLRPILSRRESIRAST